MKRKLLILIMSAIGLSGCNDFFSVGYRMGPSAPTLSLTFPTSSPSVFSKPTFTIQGLDVGDSVSLYSNNTCTNLVASGVSVGADLDLSSSTLISGSFQFAAKRTNAEGTSECSAVSVAYTHNACPLGYIPVSPNTAVGTTDEFCVMKFEAKNNGSSLPESVADGATWVNMTATQAKNFCTDPSLGPGYDLISNAEWMTIARHLEEYGSNWTSGVVGTEQMYQGHSDGGGLIATTDESDPYDGTGNSATDPVGMGKEQRRTLEFSWGETIWDFSGYNAEWVDWTLGGAQDTAPTTCFLSPWQSIEFPVMACLDLDAIDYMPANPAGVLAANYDSDYGLGQFQFPQFATGNTISRGGATNFPNSGAFWIGYNYSADAWGGTGFRCVYRP